MAVRRCDAEVGSGDRWRRCAEGVPERESWVDEVMEAADRPMPSLLEPEATGGDTAEGGFTFQQGVILAQVPRWLAEEGFTAFTRESLGDTEAKFFVPARGFEREFVEAKGYSVTPAVFWAEIARFREIERGSPGTYRRFILATAGLSTGLGSLVNGLRRIRDPHAFYAGDSTINANSFADWLRIVEAAGHTEAEARFLFEKVWVEDDLRGTGAFGEAVFKDALTRSLPEYGDLPSRALSDVYAHLQVAIRDRLNRPLDRRELEAVIRESLDPRFLPRVRPILIHTAGRPAGGDRGPGLRFDWAEFFGGEDRHYPRAERWNEQLLGELRLAREWIVQHRTGRRVVLTGERRLSAALAIGSVFSAVAGFAIEIQHRGQSWATDARASDAPPAYPLQCAPPDGRGERLVVSIGVPCPIDEEVDAALPGLGLAGMPTLHLHGAAPLDSAEQTNRAVEQIKGAVRAGLVRSGARQIDLFFAGPSFLALFLGHRLNATAPVQCYEWISPGRYVATCRLFGNGIVGG